ncbi:MAG: hypothetical protein LCH52_08240 [Bacteroidetes bacterium]|nr:hypothetical protein [Bacteroidota bacterium]
MEESLVVSIRARIDALMGVAEVENELKSLNDRVNDSAPLESVEKMRNSPLYKDLAKNVDPTSLADFQQQLSDPAKFLMQDITGDAIDFQTKINRYYGPGLLPKNQWWGRKRKADEFLDRAGDGLQNFVETAEKELLSGNLSEEEKSLRKAELAAIREAFEDLTKKLVSTFDRYFDPNKNVGDPSLNELNKGTGFLSNIENVAKMVVGSLMVGPVAQQALKNYLLGYRGGLVDEQVEAKYRSAFQVGDLMGNYGQNKMAQFFEESTRAQYGLEKLKGEGAQIGNITGVIATIVGGMVGGLPGAFLGGQAGKGVTDLFIGKSVGEQEINLQKYLTDKQSKLESDIKFMSEILANVAPKVQTYYQYDIAGARGRARIGQPGGVSQFSYMTLPEQVQEQLGFAETAGFYDNSLFKQQHDFAQMHGLEPQQVFGVNKYRWLTGKDVGAEGLFKALDYGRSQYGDNIDPSKAIKILETMLQIQSDQLKYTVKADMEKGMVLSRIPEIFFGNADPYGRIDQFGTQTLSHLGSMLQPKNLAADAWLYQTLQPKSLEEYYNIKQAGLNDAQNLPHLLTVLKGVKSDSESPALAGNRQNLFNRVLNQLGGNPPEGFASHITDLIYKGETEVTEMVDGKPTKVKRTFEEVVTALQKAIENGEKFTMLGESTDKLKDSQERYIQLLKTGAEESVAASKRSIKALSDQAASIGGTWKSMVESMQSKTNTYLGILSSVPGIFERFQKMQDISMGYQVAKMYNDGMINREQVDSLLLRVISKPERHEDIVREVFPPKSSYWINYNKKFEIKDGSDKKTNSENKLTPRVHSPEEYNRFQKSQFFQNGGTYEEWLKGYGVILQPSRSRDLESIIMGDMNKPQIASNNNSNGKVLLDIKEGIDRLKAAVEKSQAIVNVTLIKDNAMENWLFQETPVVNNKPENIYYG